MGKRVIAMPWQVPWRAGMKAERIEHQNVLAHRRRARAVTAAFCPLGSITTMLCSQCRSACTMTDAPLPLRVGPMVIRWRLSV